eukprot:4722128-Ditylum_brightwellii.AAC.1
MQRETACSSGAHPMWSGQNSCLPCEEYQKKRECEGKKGSTDEKKKTEDFKVTLLALLSKEDYKSIEEQFLN